jgi:hypothetical protein
MQNRLRMNTRQVLAVSLIVGLTGFLTFVVLFFVGIGVSDADHIPALKIAGAMGVLAGIGSLFVCFVSLWDRSSNDEQ